MFFVGGISGMVDVDVVKFQSSMLATIGIRMGIDWYVIGNVGGTKEGSPFTDYNLLIRHTGSGSLLRFDIYFGYAYYTSSTPRSVPSSGGLKFGLELRLKVVEHFMNMLLKASLPAGVGLSAGWDRY